MEREEIQKGLKVLVEGSKVLFPKGMLVMSVTAMPGDKLVDINIVSNANTINDARTVLTMALEQVNAAQEVPKGVKPN
jgi:hypothetical protein